MAARFVLVGGIAGSSIVRMSTRGVDDVMFSKGRRRFPVLFRIRYPQQVHQMAVPVGGAASATGKLQGRADSASSRGTGGEVDLRDVAIDLDELVRLHWEVAVLRATLWELLNPER